VKEAAFPTAKEKTSSTVLSIDDGPAPIGLVRKETRTFSGTISTLTAERGVQTRGFDYWIGIYYGDGAESMD